MEGGGEGGVEGAEHVASMDTTFAIDETPQLVQACARGVGGSIRDG